MRATSCGLVHIIRRDRGDVRQVCITQLVFYNPAAIPPDLRDLRVGLLPAQSPRRRGGGHDGQCTIREEELKEDKQLIQRERLGL